MLKKLSYTLLLISTIASAQAATLTVSTIQDTVADDGFCSLREAIVAANTNTISRDSEGECPAGSTSIADTVKLPAGIFNLNDTLSVTDDLILQGVNKTDTIIDGGSSIQVLSVGTEIDFELKSVRIANGGSILAGAGMLINADASVTIRDSQFSGHRSELNGGAINVDKAFLTIYDSTFSNNSGAYGGAVAGVGSSIQIHRTSFSGNSALSDGGALYSDEGLLIVKESTLTNNDAAFDGGAIVSDSYGGVELDDSVLSNNEAGDDGGAIYMDYYERLTVRNSQLFENMAGDDGGAVYVNSSTTVDLFNSRVSDNTSFSDGGGLYVYEGTLNAIDSQIDNNTSNGIGGGFYLEYPGSAQLTNTSLMGNTSTSDDGGGAYLYEATLTLLNASISDNSAPAGSGGGLFLEGAQLQAQHSIIRDNTAQLSGGGIHSEYNAVVLTNTTLSGNRVDNGDGGALYLAYDAIVELHHVTMTNNTASNSGGGIFQNDPFSLIAYSNSIIAGNTATVGPDCTLDPGARSRGYNIVGTGTGCATKASDQLVNAPLVFTDLLAPLAGNGGSTLTHALVAGSIGDNAGDPDACLPTDQRGVERQQRGNGCDIGAFERVNVPASDSSTVNNSGGGGGSLGAVFGLLAFILGGLRVLHHHSDGRR